MFPSMMRRLALAVVALAPIVTADTCSDVAAASPNLEAKTRGQLEYTSEQSHYWSTGCGALKPSCILFPSTAHEVSAIVAVLRDNNETFAVKSGGHNPNNYWASVDGGPLISTKNLDEVTLDADAKTVRVGPGNRWDAVQTALDGTGFTVVGGRIGDVGVGGYLLGGGLSFMSTQYGWGANSVVEFEVVLPNATIVTASATHNKDLFDVLRGGGNSFGVVTSFLLEAHPIGDVWGGNYIFNATDETSDAILKAVRDFTEYYPDDKAGIIVTAETTAVGLVDLWVLFLYYNGPTLPAGVFDNFTAIHPGINTCKTRSYADLLTANNWGNLQGSVYTIGTETTPLPPAAVGLDVMRAYYDHWRNVTHSVIGISGLISSMAFQPLPRRVAAHARGRGGDMMDLDDDVDRIIVEFDYSFLFNTDFPKVDRAMQETYGGIRERVLAFQDEGVLPDAYLPIFMNDGYFRADWAGRLRPEKAALGKRVSEAVDAKGLFRDRTGGFKF